jgi:hypothetical protein
MPLEPFSQTDKPPVAGSYARTRTALARAELESLLRTRQLDRTLTTALPGGPETDLASTGIAALDAQVGGGLPRGHISEVVGPRSSGRTSLTLQMLAAATARGELVALVDGLDVFDAAEAPPDALRRLPFTTWLRLQRMVEGSQTTCVLVGGDTMARSSAGLTLRTGIRDWGLGIRFQNRLFDGLEIRAQVVRARAHAQEDATVVLTTVATHCA